MISWRLKISWDGLLCVSEGGCGQSHGTRRDLTGRAESWGSPWTQWIRIGTLTNSARGFWYTVTSEKAESILSGPLHPYWLAYIPEWSLVITENVLKRSRVLNSSSSWLRALSSFQGQKCCSQETENRIQRTCLGTLVAWGLSLLEQVSLLRKTWWWSLHLWATSPSSKWMASFYGNLGYWQHWTRVGGESQQWYDGTSLEIQWSGAFTARVRVQSLVGGLGSHVLWDQKKSLELNKNKKIKTYPL